MEKQNKKYKELLRLARQTIESKFHGDEVKISDEIKKKFSKKQACFVTLTEDKMLRGCIGSLEPRQELWKDVVENAVHAAFHDYRFMPVSESEIKKIKIEISVLSIPKKLGIGEEVFDKINKKMGIILEKSGRSSTFLPQVWEQINDKKEFLEELSMKAGLNKDAWETAELSFYEVEKVEED
ncbi:MAG: AmmeMemoRadiSam system protein A [Candidatus Nanoarchaeia archaeon]|nr:AmmeMemoRadiSam system protein A [Candidatus Nanoarchaeia archaeon]MDD5741791.1 AmmeMemoRadiSam system protein A [Candidatus Nanoarchaeia archaeon]